MFDAACGAVRARARALSPLCLAQEAPRPGNKVSKSAEEGVHDKNAPVCVVLEAFVDDVRARHDVVRQRPECRPRNG